MVAAGAAFRSGHNWYAIRFNCTVGHDLASVVAFQFMVGDPVPESQWDSHGLNAADEDE